jgi:hypothetical protein
MGREIRRVPADWQHPQLPPRPMSEHQRFAREHVLRLGLLTSEEVEPEVRYKSQLEGPIEDAIADWEAEKVEQKALWDQRKCEYVDDDIYDKSTFEEYFDENYGEAPDQDLYMPSWTEEQKTHLMMYQNTSEGTPISPAFETPEELARWLADNNASAFGSDGATYEQWLGMCKSGWAPSAILSNGVLQSGVAALNSGDAEE